MDQSSCSVRIAGKEGRPAPFIWASNGLWPGAGGRTADLGFRPLLATAVRVVHRRHLQRLDVTHNLRRPCRAQRPADRLTATDGGAVGGPAWKGRGLGRGGGSWLTTGHPGAAVGPSGRMNWMVWTLLAGAGAAIRSALVVGAVGTTRALTPASASGAAEKSASARRVMAAFSVRHARRGSHPKGRPSGRAP